MTELVLELAALRVRLIGERDHAHDRALALLDQARADGRDCLKRDADDEFQRWTAFMGRCGIAVRGLDLLVGALDELAGADGQADG